MLGKGALALAAFIASAAPAMAQDAVENFYRGKTITVVVASDVGGGYDSFGRLVARHIGKYIPGHPNVVPTNMSGAGGSVATNYIYAVAPHDGTFMAITSVDALLAPLLTEKNTLKYEPLKFNYLGSAGNEAFICIVRADSGVTTFADAFSKQVVLGATGGAPHDMPRADANVLGVKFKLVTGYSGVREIALAMDRGEVQGLCAVGIANMMGQRPDWFAPGSPMRVIVQESISGDPGLNKQGVPRTVDFAKTPEQRQVLEIVYAQGEFTRPFIMAPDIPPDRVDAMRKAFLQALADPDLLSEAKKQSLTIVPVSGPDLEAKIRKIYAAPPEIIEDVRKALTDP